MLYQRIGSMKIIFMDEKSKESKSSVNIVLVNVRPLKQLILMKLSGKSIYEIHDNKMNLLRIRNELCMLRVYTEDFNRFVTLSNTIYSI